MPIKKRQTLLAKIETTYGADPTPSASADAVRVIDVTPSPDFKQLVRDFARSSLSSLQHAIGRKVIGLQFGVEMKGSGAAYSSSVKPEMAQLLRACGLSETIDTTASSENIVYAPVSSGFESITIYFNFDGLRHKLVGGYGSVDVNAVAGEYAIATFNFIGKYGGTVDEALPSPTLSSVLPPVFASGAITFNGNATGVYGNMQFGIQNDIQERPDANSSDGFVGYALVGRAATASLDPEAVLEATHAWWADFQNAIAAALTASIGATQYNKCDISAPKAQISSMGHAERSGLTTYAVSLNLAQNSGDDEITLTFN